MWFLGLIIGAIIGAVGGGAGALVGALAGAGAGWALSQKSKTAADERLVIIELTVRQLTQRIQALENATLATGTAVTMPIAEYQQSPSSKTPSEETARSPSSVEPPVSVAADSLSGVVQQPSEREATESAQPVFAPELQRAGASAAAQSQQPTPLWNFFFGANALVRFGVIVLFLGVAFLLKYATEHIYIPIEVRLMGVALGAIVLLGIGWGVRQSRPGYGLIMQGGGIGVLYLTVFAAFRLYQLLPSGLVLVLLAAIAVLSAMLAVLQDSRSLASIGVSGGFLAPLLASTGRGSHVMLFSFYALLNLGILGIAWHKAWRSLNLLGFIFTFVIGLAWSNRYYRPELFGSTEPFLILFFLFYVAIAVLFAIRQEATIKSRVDGALVFGTPLIAFGLQTALVRDIEYGAAFSALALSAFYLLLAKVLYARGRDNLRLLVEAFIALGVVFGTLAIPLGLDGRWTSAVWALEGAGIVWVGVRQEKRLARWFGVLLQFGAGVASFVGTPGPRAVVPVFNSFYLSCVFVSVAGLFCAWYLRRHRDQVTESEGRVAIALFCWGILWWFVAGLNEITDHVLRVYRVHAVLMFVIASCAAFSVLRRRLDWREARYPALALMPLMYALALIDFARGARPSEYFGYIAWPLAFTTHFWLLHRHEDDAQSMLLRWWHAAGVWLLAALGGWEAARLIGDIVQGGQAWQLIGWALVPGMLLAWLTAYGERLTWPVARHLGAYLFDGAFPLVIFLWLWMNFANFNSNGDAAPLPYLPLINPLDLAQAGALLVQFAWFKRIRTADFAPQDLKSSELTFTALGIAAFVWLNGVLLRTLHHWAGVPFLLDAMLRSMLVQAAFSIFWSVLALCAMLTATPLRLRPLWLTGAGLMAVVVVKLFFIDLANVGGIERIVSFIGVGLLMLLVGYVSPVPPSTTEEGK
jgi:uncharacterized membrane protein